MKRILTLLLLIGLLSPVVPSSAGGWQKALGQLKEKARSGDTRAQEVLAKMYATGEGVHQDRSEAKLWAMMAKEQNSKRAKALLGTLLFMEATGVKQRAAAIDLWQQAAVQGYAQAQFRLALSLSRGDAGRADPVAAFRWMGKAASGGIVLAKYLLGVMYEFGHGVPGNTPLAAHWYQKAAKNNFAPAQSALGGLYLQGEGLRQDLAMAYFWYNLAAEQGYQPAVRHRKELRVQTPDNNISLQEEAKEQLKVCLKQTDMLCQFDLIPGDDRP